MGARPPTSPSSSPTRPKNGQRSFARPISSRSDPPSARSPTGRSGSHESLHVPRIATASCCVRPSTFTAFSPFRGCHSHDHLPRFIAGALASASADWIAIRRACDQSQHRQSAPRDRVSWAVASALLRVARFVLGRSGSLGYTHPFRRLRLADPLIPFRLIQLSLAVRLLGWSDLEAIRSEPSRCRASITHLNGECRR